MSEYRIHNLEEYDDVLDLKKQGYSNPKISEMTKIPYHTVNSWVRGKQRPFIGTIRKIIHFPEVMSSELSYIFGVLCGDGWIRDGKHNGSYHIGLGVIDEDFMLEYKRCFDNIFETNLNIKYGPKKGGQNQYTTVFCSKQLVRWLTERSTFKTEDWRVPKEIEGYEEPFLRGLFDSEGSVRYRTKASNREIKFCTKSKEGFDWVCQRLKYLGIKFTLSQRKDGLFLLNMYTKESITIFYEKIGFSIQRKQERLIQCL